MRHRHAFTLIELLVVIAIIALLVSILMPSLQKAKEMAKDVVCAANLHSIGYAMYLYAQDFDEQLPYYFNAYREQPFAFTTWAERIGRIPEDRIPSGDREPLPSTASILRGGYVDYRMGDKDADDVFRCPTARDQITPRSKSQSNDYSMTKQLCPDVNWDQEVRTVRLTDFKVDLVLVADGIVDRGSGDFIIRHRLRVDWRESSLGRFGPWPQQTMVAPFGARTPVDFYGHTGERSVLAFVSGKTVITKDLRAEMFYDKRLGDTSPP